MLSRSRHLLFFVAVLILEATCRRERRQSLPGSECVVEVGDVLRLPCQVAIFGGFVPEVKTDISSHVVVADPINACTPPRATVVASNVVLLVERGGCSFTEKMLHVAAQGGSYMVLINSDDSLLRMQTNEWVNSTVVAVSVRHADGRRLLDHHTAAGGAATAFSISYPKSVLSQCLDRIKMLLEINAPCAAVETFYDCSPHGSHPSSKRRLLSADVNRAAFYSQTSMLLRMSAYVQMDAVRRALLTSSVLAVQFDIHPSAERLVQAADELYLGGYLDDARDYFIQAASFPSAPSRAFCGAAQVAFLLGDYLNAMTWYATCKSTLPSSPTQEFPSVYDPATTSMETLFGTLPLNATHMACLEHATLEGVESPSPPCCTATVEGERVVLRHASPYVKYLYETFTLMGVFLDELGAYEASQVHMTHGLRLCGKATGLDVRMTLAIPTVFRSTLDMHEVTSSLLNRIHSLDRANDPIAKFVRPEDAGHLRWTITPPSMFVGYQGEDPAPVQLAIASMYQRLYSFPLAPLPPSASPPSRIKVGFASSWFRTHSVGKLIRGVLSSLDRNKFDVIVYAATHFFPPPSDDDAITKAIRDASDEFVVLPPSQPMALDLIARAKLDILVFPEIGMDSWIYFLAHHRLAPVQCMFWGHPITTGLPTIDYFIASEYYFPDFFESGTPIMDDQVSTYGGASYKEQMVLFSDLTTYFTEPVKLPHVSDPVSLRALFHLPLKGRLYVCPQTLMKLHVDFDAVIRRVLERDGGGIFVLLYSPKQVLWKERLVRRFNTSLGPHVTRRVVFLETMAYDMFMQLLASADVMLDPFPFGGGVTTLDALAVGLPVITLPSRQTVVQLTAGFYRYMNVTDCIAASMDEFVNSAIAVATNPAYRQKLVRDIQDARGRIYATTSTTSNEWNTFLAHVHRHAV
ncbi:Aste57867_21903 [Aphanomyces stellatus]|uniref:Aste57867_21903 protein n=1 Tax=Aphanomyces stellatus TaxID=120398 RepID=A0A485LK40_9STRA|nr:hypothetical protein As57867_021834 [Aphanomyces stellatus]VFT98571.1 Aste57867_21903 [Aphanomyces stellatus]